ncbi:MULTISPECIES: DUF2513 domain-containing protein [Pseudomonas]|uniref:DUF2513 domain-containing protein n=1 Tax=Pseudomonas TaxID=286 RepID=UPI000CFC5E64|nr:MULTISPECIES: DUF2513 domain-containing protein [Pseudomonas]PQZ91913.1 hypothetical protein CQ048_10760 [Pseudomonas trivialis]PRB27880.1 hypothetical protein CQ041_08790 [Pseudomonas sp. MYb60]
MRRDMDLMRLVVLKVEEDHQGPNHLVEYEDFNHQMVIEGFTPDQVEYHLKLAMQSRLFDMPGNAGWLYIFQGLTPAGHDFADSVRDEKIWKMTKEGALKAGGLTFELLGQLAKGLIKQQLEKHTGVAL